MHSTVISFIEMNVILKRMPVIESCHQGVN